MIINNNKHNISEIQMENRIKSLPEKIHYSNNKEYRQQIRYFFDICKNARSYYVDISFSDSSSDSAEAEDDETRDELHYDSSVVETGMKELFNITNNHPQFKELYLYAAGRMFSTDLTIGQAVICSYDTFRLYYTCIWHLIHNNEITNLEEYQQLKKWFL
jgi:hypothetical protein